jgi:hypothetical protein
MPDGRRRDAVYYSVLKAEWPEVKEQLLTKPKAVPVDPLKAVRAATTAEPTG